MRILAVRMHQPERPGQKDKLSDILQPEVETILQRGTFPISADDTPDEPGAGHNHPTTKLGVGCVAVHVKPRKLRAGVGSVQKGMEPGACAEWESFGPSDDEGRKL